MGGVEGQRTVDGVAHLVAIVDQHGEMRPRRRQGRVVGITGFGLLQHVHRRLDVLEEAGGPGFGKRGIGAACGFRRLLNTIRIGQRAGVITAIGGNRLALRVKPAGSAAEQFRGLRIIALGAGKQRADEIGARLLAGGEAARLGGLQGGFGRTAAAQRHLHLGQRQPVLGAAAGFRRRIDAAFLGRHVAHRQGGSGHECEGIA